MEKQPGNKYYRAYRPIWS